MKKFLSSTILMLCCIPALAQVKTPPPDHVSVAVDQKTNKATVVKPSYEDLQKKLDLQAIDIALNNYKSMTMQIQQEAEKALGPARQSVVDAVNQARVDRGLDDSYEYDPAKKDFVKKAPPEAKPSSTGAPAAKPEPPKKP